MKLFLAASVLAVAALLAARPASAQANRTFVSGHGTDTNPCSIGAPCRTFQHAHDQTNAGGEITVLDPGGYGSVTINKAISIVNDGIGEAGVTTASAIAGITINAGPNDVVNLRGLTLVGQGVGTDGIAFNAGSALNVENCTIGGFVNRGILVSTGASLNVSDTSLTGNGLSGTFITPSGSGSVGAVFKRVQARKNGLAGVKADGSFTTGVIGITFSDSVASNNAVGLLAISTTGKAVTTLVAVRSEIANNSNGLQAQGTNASIFLAESTVAGNATAFNTSGGGALNSYNNNYVAGNALHGSALSSVSPE